MSPRTGRPPVENAKDFLLQVRIDRETLKVLDECAEENGTSRSEIVRKGIKLVKQQAGAKK